MQHTSADRPPLDPPRTQAEVLERYRALLGLQHSRHAALLTRQRRALQLLAAIALLIAWQAAHSLHGAGAAWPMLLTFSAAALVIVYLVQLQSPITTAQRLVSFYESSLRRADGCELFTSRTGEDAFPSTSHLYQHDLDVTGSSSLFAMLATVRTGIGERGLARYLLLPAPHEESVRRQQAVRELVASTSLRESIALLGASSFQQLSGAFFDDWLEDTPPTIHPAFRYVLGTTTVAFLALVAAGLFQLRSWSALLPNLLAVLALQAIFAMLLRSRVKPLLEGGARLQGQIRLFAEGLAVLQALPFTSPKLVELQRLSRTPAGAVKMIKRLDSQLVIVEQRTKEFFFILSLLIAAGSQAAISIAGWKRRHAAAMRAWLDAWAEFEALNALATYAFEHPTGEGVFCWPELLPSGGEAVFVAEHLAHPLLADSVANDISLGEVHTFLLISGSNMAGKSTLLRSIGLASVLAYAGAPVRARSLRISPLAVGASIALTDSLAEGKSKFLAEVERLAAIVALSQSRPVLFLVDEIFSGTNSLDRRTAAAAVLDRLLKNGAIGALSTHDLALTSLATDANLGLNVHMASPDPTDPLGFDYVLKPGINRHSNALAIIRLMGLNS